MAWNASHNIPQNMLQNISQNIPQNMPWNISHDMLHNMAQDPPMNTQYSPSLSLLPVSRQPSQNEMHYFSTSSSGTPLSQSGGSLSCESPSTERTSPPESIEDGMETPRPASIASISRQTTPLAQGGLAQADLPPSVPSRSDSSSVVSRISRRGSNQQTLNIPSRLSTHSEVDVGSRAQTPLPPHPPRPTTAQQRYRPVTTKGPPPAAFNTRYAPTGGLRHRRSVGVDGVRRNNPQASPSTPILSHHSSSTSIPGLPQQKTGSSLHRKAMDCVHAEHRGRNPSIITEPPPGHGDVIDTTSTPQKRSVSLFRSLTHNFRPKRTALVDSYALAQGAYTVSTAESSAKRTEVGRRDPMHRQVMVPNIRDHGREHMGPSMRQINRETGLTVPTLYERIELRESMRGNKPTRQRL
ncbi:hypothetical protein CC80DRAFT_498383 [Byssothecium circinans]|uniref:Uncharacterized protein n=1 Tax=Byssothecium circinans TaxID=147558 RepID=A0A6A5T5G1_9PLEO|nr:hypothetical protein CC80DRAFT_498383 [Byssothecium circinans]